MISSENVFYCINNDTRCQNFLLRFCDVNQKAYRKEYWRVLAIGFVFLTELQKHYITLLTMLNSLAKLVKFTLVYRS